MARSRQQRPAPNRPAEWQFFTFPVAYALAAGMVFGIFLAFTLGLIGFYLVLFAFSFGTAHIIGHALRRRGLDKRVEAEEEAERERRALAARAARQAGEQPTDDQPAPTARRRRRRRN